jgi:hypothetical protein
MIVCFKCNGVSESDIDEWVEIEPGLEAKVCITCIPKKKKAKHDYLDLESAGNKGCGPVAVCATVGAP